ncbi:MAG: bifunctional 23S rRNA (guanine(2069)-N(7))-methyltransferase RlmK/23S rRNA (guanine(2445)-N(2))-methyltransferase RlmL [Deltaproteobacteria bacterium]|nr:bifunctional 23S rRNA (guanine(2069)-N(7))-methyltransferase RlmK/23S rRNA (guanine(2445)-N(2))-methyltransferase RlmL [Deltaproteobacteria bacterium]MBI3294069.1 bifunctional 23S rRNA (guanine(2069)-N(7))-methyltransferase RlmK/23S rRNA (guanine(2445)-N(2))-methyltransferase RlmL [Deltaproteobacteria bacterium]
MTSRFPIHVRTLTGLEDILSSELKALGADPVAASPRLVTCVGNQSLLYKANLWCRTAIRVLVPIHTFSAADEKAYYQGIRTIDWSRWLSAKSSLTVDAHVHSSFSQHSLFVAQLTKDAVVDTIRDRYNDRPSVERVDPDLRINISLFQNTVTVFLDSSGESLHKRGYRKQTGEAPLSEALAAGLVRLSRWDPAIPFLDPMTGSGTLCIEAGLIATNQAPGLKRAFGFERWPDFNRSLWNSLRTDAESAIRPAPQTQIIGLEKDERVAAIARDNAERAGLTNIIRIETADFFEWKKEFSMPGVVVVNPPYDDRLPVDNTAQLYQDFGDQLKRAYPGWRASVLTGNLEAAKFFGLRTSSRTTLFNGPIECRLLEYELRSEPFLERPRATPEGVLPLWSQRAEMLKNRLTKVLKRHSRWTERERVTCWRVYNWDIPELPYLIDLYGDRLHFAEIERNHDHSPLEHTRYTQLMRETAASTLGVAPEKVYFKKRKPQKSGGFQYSAHDTTNEFLTVLEGGHQFLVNLADYLDVGLFLDHRVTRRLVEKAATGKDVLNLFAYTGSFSVYAAKGGARSTTTVDTSRAYLDWAERNMTLNGFSDGNHRFIRSDVLEFLERTTLQFDLSVVDPPTRSVNRSSGRTFDVQSDHTQLLSLVLDRMRPGGQVFFSTNYRTFAIDEAGLKAKRAVTLREISQQTIPPDFQGKPSHRCWKIDVPA